MEEIEYEAVPAPEARRVARREYGKLLLARWATIAGMMAAGACVLVLVSSLTLLPTNATVIAPSALLSFLAGWWLRGRVMARRSSGRSTGRALERAR